MFSFRLVILIDKACWISRTVRGVGEHAIQPRSLRALFFELPRRELTRENVLPYLLWLEDAIVGDRIENCLRCVEILGKCSKFIFDFCNVVQ